MSGAGKAIKKTVKKTFGKTLKRALSLDPRESLKALDDVFNPKQHLNDIEMLIDEIGGSLVPEQPDIVIDNGTPAPIAAMPDEEELRRARRRRGASSRSGRSATILSGSSTDTLGG